MIFTERASRTSTDVAALSIDRYAVTNNEFASFVNEAGYATTAETPFNPDTTPGMPPDYFAAGSLVFTGTTDPVPLNDFRNWWKFVGGASWRHPEGLDGALDDRVNIPWSKFHRLMLWPIAIGRANFCRLKKSGNTQHAAA